jgi:hypothetical protein
VEHQPITAKGFRGIYKAKRPKRTATKLLPETITSTTLPCGALTLEASLFPVAPANTDETTPPIPPFVMVVPVAVASLPGDEVMDPLGPTETLRVTPAAPVGTG